MSAWRELLNLSWRAWLLLMVVVVVGSFVEGFVGEMLR